MTTSARSLADAKSSLPFSAAASPAAILRLRSSIGPRIIGHTNFIVNQIRTMNTSICTINVRLMFTFFSRPARLPGAALVGQPGSERIREREEQREADADHGDRVDQCRHDEHLDLQHWSELRLPGRALEKAAAKNSEADGGAERAQAEDDADGEHGHGLDGCNIFHSILLNETDARLM